MASAAERSGTRRVYALSVLLALLGSALVVGWIREMAPVSAALQIPWWWLVPLFAANDAFTVAVRTGRHSKTIALSEIPLAVGLVFCGPLGLVVARTVGGIAALAMRGRRSSPMKTVFNSSMFVVEACVAVLTYRAVLGQADPLSLHGWFAVGAAVLASGAVDIAALSAVTALHDGRARRWAELRDEVRLVAFAALLCTALGLIAVLALAADPRAAAVLVMGAVLLLVASRAYNRLQARHESVELLHQLTTALGEAPDQRTAVAVVVHRCARLITGRSVELHLPPKLDDDGGGLSITLCAGATGRRPLHERETLSAAVADHPGGRLLRTPTQDAPGRAALDLLGEQEALLMPFVADNLAGLLVVAGRPDGARHLSAYDLKLLQLVATHAAASLEKGMLIERLRHEVLSKEHQALHDALTGLPNRTLFAQRVDEALAGVPAGRNVAVMLCDLDRFKEVNDTLGHHTGDQLLRAIGARLRSTLRPQDTVARLGGDEFAVLLPDVASQGEATAAARRVLDAIEAPAPVGELTLFVGASIGIALAPLHGEDAVALLQRADIAMYAAKAGRHGVQVYVAEDDVHSHDRLALVGELRHAIDNRELIVHFQPKAEAATATIVGVEALVRWNHPHRGVIPPDEFIPMAEHTGLIRPLTAYVMREALACCALWREDGLDLTVAVNISVESLLDANLPGDVRRLLGDAGVGADRLTLEVTESMIMADVERAIAILAELQAMGVGVSIDDFGTGYSSLFQLKRLPVTELKIDRSFVRDMTSDDNDAVIVRSTIDLGHNLGLRVVAEGVEDHATWEALRALHCDEIQGYFMSPALPREAIDAWVRRWTCDQAGLAPVR